MFFSWIYVEYAIRLILAMLCGGIIGYEREVSNHPAGFRTHVLVCVASALILVTSDAVFVYYSSIVNLDPMRLGAQIISGIGFLGAGAIVKEGVTVKGLTSAACLWSVASIGIALGVGFYFGALLTTAIVFVALIYFRNLENFFARGKSFYSLNIAVSRSDKENIIGEIKEVFSLYHAKIRKISDIAVGDVIYIKFDFYLDRIIPIDALVETFTRLDGVSSVRSNSGVAA